MRLMAIDPGNEKSAYVIINEHYKPVSFLKTENRRVRLKCQMVSTEIEAAYIEQIGHYGTGMPAGVEVFDTCIWIGRFIETLDPYGYHVPVLVKRATIKAHICGSAKATDANVRQALVDRFAPGEMNFGKGTKAKPGWFYGFSADIWQAYALAVYALDMLKDAQGA